MRWLWALPVVALVIINWLGNPDYSFRQNQQLMQMLQQSADQLPRQLLQHNRNGELVLASTGQRISETEIAVALQQRKEDQARPYLWQDNTGKPAVLSAQGTDRQHHFANSFLVGARPFPIDNPALPLYFLAQRKVYQYDQEQYQRGDVWQNSAQAWVYLRGDCEDHAMILADWLIAEGFDARVVIGSYRGEGHAWVVALLQGQTYLFEATDKQAGKTWQHLPLAALATDYQPELMFNRDTFWISTHPATARDHRSTHWLETARFSEPERAAPRPGG